MLTSATVANVHLLFCAARFVCDTTPNLGLENKPRTPGCTEWRKAAVESMFGGRDRSRCGCTGPGDSQVGPFGEKGVLVERVNVFHLSDELNDVRVVANCDAD